MVRRGRDEDAGWTVEVWLVLNSLIAGVRGCSVTEVAICEKAGRNFGIGSHSTEMKYKASHAFTKCHYHACNEREYKRKLFNDSTAIFNMLPKPSYSTEPIYTVRN
ncbi:hypothetical protein AVEN_140948-1 [Araneus ventricosus]|uniref:Uncharacterized protein n=1 Tax=Araneus ventricosus TaxID=182803 RepID=A0A4Y2GCA7_ARAVE|nr:hypothetical protein AVEN_140948-1 [Araneus ventricosus]